MKISKLRKLSQCEIDMKDQVISKLCNEILSSSEGIEGQCRGTPDDIELIGYIYYEGMENLIDQDLLKRGGHLLLGDILVNTLEFEWRIMEGGNEEYCVISEHFPEPIMIEQIEKFFIPHPIDEEPPGFSEYLSYAYECIEREYKRKKYGMWIPEPDTQKQGQPPIKFAKRVQVQPGYQQNVPVPVFSERTSPYFRFLAHVIKSFNAFCISTES